MTAYREVRVRTPLALKILPVVSVAAFFFLWEFVVRSGIVPETMLAAPSNVARLFMVKLTEMDPDGALLQEHAWISIQEAFTGYFLSLAVGIPLGLAMGWFIVAEGLAQKWPGPLNCWPRSSEPTTLPLSLTRLPLAWRGNRAWASPVTSAG